MTSEDEMQLFRDMEFKVDMPALSGLAMKEDMGLPWNKNVKYEAVKINNAKSIHHELQILVNPSGN